MALPRADNEPTRGPHWSAAAPLALGLLGMFGAAALSLGSLSVPAPGLWPFIISACMVLLSVPLLLTRWGAAGTEVFGRGAWQTMIGAASIGVFVLMFEQVGLLVPSFLLLLLWCRLLGRESWKVSIAVALIAPAIAYAVFDLALNVPFPDDIVAVWS
jgi:putative tricarboxylic transport membrane protein